MSFDNQLQQQRNMLEWLRNSLDDEIAERGFAGYETMRVRGYLNRLEGAVIDMADAWQELTAEVETPRAGANVGISTGGLCCDSNTEGMELERANGSSQVYGYKGAPQSERDFSDFTL